MLRNLFFPQNAVYFIILSFSDQIICVSSTMCLKFRYHPNCLKDTVSVKRQIFRIWESLSISHLRFISMKLLVVVFVYHHWEMCEV